MRPDPGCLRVSGLLGALGVGLGAFGAHGLRDLLQRNGTADIWETAVFYHLVHVVAMLALSLSGRATRGPWTCFLAGVLIFSGSLYALAITNVRGLGAITPIGGAAMIAGWVWLLVRPPADPVVGSSRRDDRETHALVGSSRRDDRETPADSVPTR